MISWLAKMKNRNMEVSIVVKRRCHSKFRFCAFEQNCSKIMLSTKPFYDTNCLWMDSPMNTDTASRLGWVTKTSYWYNIQYASRYLEFANKLHVKLYFCWFFFLSFFCFQKALKWEKTNVQKKLQLCLGQFPSTGIRLWHSS